MFFSVVLCWCAIRFFKMDFDLSEFERLPPVKAKGKSEVKLYNLPELKPLICVPFTDEERTYDGGSSLSDQDLLQLKDKLDSIRISNFRFDGGGDCTVQNPVSAYRTETIFSVFDDLIERITTGCHEQGYLLGRIRTDIGKTIASYQKHYINTIAHSSQMQLKLLDRIEKLREKVDEEKEELIKFEELERKSSDCLSEKVSESSIGVSQARGRQMDLLEIAEQKKEKLKELILRTVKPLVEEEEEEQETEQESDFEVVQDPEII